MKGSDVPLTDVILPHQKFDMGDFYKKRRFFEKFFLQAIDQRKMRLSDSRFSLFAVDNLQIFLYFTQNCPFCQQLFRLWYRCHHCNKKLQPIQQRVAVLTSSIYRPIVVKPVWKTHFSTSFPKAFYHGNDFSALISLRPLAFRYVT